MSELVRCCMSPSVNSLYFHCRGAAVGLPWGCRVPPRNIDATFDDSYEAPPPPSESPPSGLQPNETWLRDVLLNLSKHRRLYKKGVARVQGDLLSWALLRLKLCISLHRTYISFLFSFSFISPFLIIHISLFYLFLFVVLSLSFFEEHGPLPKSIYHDGSRWGTIGGTALSKPRKPLGGRVGTVLGLGSSKSSN